MVPEQGVRFELRLEFATDGGAVYALKLELSSGSWLAKARISAAGEVTFDWSGAAEPPAWCIAPVRAQLRTLFRDHGKDGAYPRRLTRWRPAPEAAPGQRG